MLDLDENQKKMLERHRLFVKEVCANEQVFGLNDGNGFATSYSAQWENQDGEPILLVCFWSDAQKALACKKGNWGDYELQSISLSEFLEGWCLDMAADGVAVGSNFDTDLFGCEVGAMHLISEIITELKAIGKEIPLENYDSLEEFEDDIL